jgi:hypothetical protein
MKESQRYTYLLCDVMKKNFECGFLQEELWKFVEKKKVLTYKMSDIAHWVYYPCWSYPLKSGSDECFYSIYQVLMDPKNKNFKKDIKRIRKAKTDYPIIVVQDEFDKHGVILDGAHRFARMILEKRKVVKYQYITLKELNKIKNRV